MALYPGAVFKPTAWGGKTPRNRQGRGILHVAVSTRVSYPPFSGNTWHFYVAAAAPDGSTNGSGGPAYCEQYVDTDFRAYGDVDANDDAIVVETAGAANPATINSEPWTRAQELRIADIMRWEAGQPGGAPLELLPDSRAGRRGWGPHRLGIKHSAGPRLGWWQPGGEVWSTSLGKECPGDAKVAQVPGLIQLARQADDDMQLTDRVGPVTNVRGEQGTVTVAEALGGAWEIARGGFWQEQEARITALTETVRALATQQSGVDVDALLAGVEKIVQANRAKLDVQVTPSAGS